MSWPYTELQSIVTPLHLTTNYNQCQASLVTNANLKSCREGISGNVALVSLSQHWCKTTAFSKSRTLKCNPEDKSAGRGKGQEALILWLLPCIFPTRHPLPSCCFQQQLSCLGHVWLCAAASDSSPPGSPYGIFRQNTGGVPLPFLSPPRTLQFESYFQLSPFFGKYRSVGKLLDVSYHNIEIWCQLSIRLSSNI